MHCYKIQYIINIGNKALSTRGSRRPFFWVSSRSRDIGLGLGLGLRTPGLGLGLGLENSVSATSLSL